MTDYSILMTTAGSSDEAETIAKELLSRRLAACVQVTEIRSFYTWKGEVANEPEFLMLVKTPTSYVEKAQATILEVHSYETPEVVAVAIESGSAQYLEWMNSVTGESETG